MRRQRVPERIGWRFWVGFGSRSALLIGTHSRALDGSGVAS